MDRRSFAQPPVWTDHELDAQRQAATARFIAERVSEGAIRYEAMLHQCLRDVSELFAATDDLQQLRNGRIFASEPALLMPARYLGGPPISEDDLNVLAEGNVAARKRLPEDLAAKAAAIIEAALDRERFPWLFGERPRGPTNQEREVALRWTAGLWAAQRVATARRSESAARQERAVRNLLREAGFVEASQKPTIDVTATDLNAGQFCGETRVLDINCDVLDINCDVLDINCDVLDINCDVPVKLFDNRLLLVECKASNSGLNSVKRLIRETGGKAAHWAAGFGERAITAAVLSGVFNLRHLVQAQRDYRVTIFWEHDLTPLAGFVRSAVRPRRR